jgi:hypothetical protein
MLFPGDIKVSELNAFSFNAGERFRVGLKIHHGSSTNFKPEQNRRGRPRRFHRAWNGTEELVPKFIHWRPGCRW